MGDYTSEATIYKLMPQLPNTTTANGYTVASAFVAQAIYDAEAEINGYAARRYSLPFSEVPVQIRAIADGLATFYTYLYVYPADNMNRNDFTDDPRYRIQLGKLESIAKGDIALTLTNGSLVMQASTTSMIASVHKNHTPIFNMDTVTSHAVDSGLLSDISDDRH